MKKLMYLVFLILFSNELAIGQCSVKTAEVEDGFMVAGHTREKIYNSGDVYGDYENGFLVVHARLLKYYDPGTGSSVPQMTIMVSSKGSYRMVVPRKVRVSFSNGQNFEILAESLEDLSLEMRNNSQESTFMLTDEQFGLLKNHSVTQLVVSDQRTGQEQGIVPYEDIFKEEANCLARYK